MHFVEGLDAPITISWFINVRQFFKLASTVFLTLQNANPFT